LGVGEKPFESMFPNCHYVGIDFTKDGTKADQIVDLNHESIPYGDEEFDVVIASESMEHIFNNLNVVSEIKRVVKKGGYIYMSTPFMFQEHGSPYDFFRFTQYYYKKMFGDCRLLRFSQSNTFVTTPLVLFSLVIHSFLSIHKFGIGKILMLPRYAMIFLCNCIGIVIDKILSKVHPSSYLGKRTHTGPISYCFLFQK
jgi:SAM-dependent methyltransferase